MSDASIHYVVAAIAAAVGMIAGRAIAIEGGKGLSSVFAASYIGAGVGLMSAIIVGPLLTLVAHSFFAGPTAWFDALDVAGVSILWGTVAGAGGGFLLGVVIVALPSNWLASR